MEHLGTKRLETDRLILRQFQLSDAEEMFKSWASDREVTQYLTWETHKDVEETKSIIKNWLENYEDLDFYEWVIILKETNKPVGSIGTVYVEDEETYEISYCLAKEYWGNAYIPEALREVIRFFMEDVKVNKIVAKHHLDNIKSAKVMEKAGMEFDGEALCYGNSLSYYRARVYTMTKDRWDQILEGKIDFKRNNNI